MQRYFAPLLRIRHPDEDVQRRGRNAVFAALGMILVVLLSIPLTLDGPDWWLVLAAELICIVIFCAMIWLARAFVTCVPVWQRRPGRVPMGARRLSYPVGAARPGRCPMCCHENRDSPW